MTCWCLQVLVRHLIRNATCLAPLAPSGMGLQIHPSPACLARYAPCTPPLPLRPFFRQCGCRNLHLTRCDLHSVNPPPPPVFPPHSAIASAAAATSSSCLSVPAGDMTVRMEFGRFVCDACFAFAVPSNDGRRARVTIDKCHFT